MDVLPLKQLTIFNRKNMNSGTCVQHPIENIGSKNHHHQRTSNDNNNSNNNNINVTTTSNNNNRESISSIDSNFDHDEFSVENFYKLMRFERLRMVTYILYDHQWPKMDIISPASLARAGFFYYKNDTVCCAFCRGKVRNWEEGDLAMEEHKRHFPNCQFVQGKPVGNVPIESDPDINCNDSSVLSHFYVDDVPGQEPIKINYNKSMTPKFPPFIEKKKREMTFSHANWPKTGKPDKKSFIDAGFFFTGKEDRTRCFHCGGNLLNWKPEENPMEEHALFFPECPFIISIKGAAYLEFVKFKKQIIEMRSKIETPFESKVYDINCLRKITFENFTSMKQAARRILNRLGQPELTQQTYQEYLDKFFFFLDCNKLFYHLSKMNVLSNHEDNNINNNNDNDRDSNSPLRNSSIFCLPESSDSDYSSSNSDYEDNNLTSKSEQETSSSSLSLFGNANKQRNQSSLLCLICCDKMIQVVFLPCGHQMACMKCSTQLNKCPICRKIITDKVRTYFATMDD
ncbi:baculoviral IAP repeat-containing protein 3-like protein [Euroglyphus maynei]|uniref:Baculoviral IAP repeat-containing protein 3-like protein n=1 Tax=Euroglyphus maynei TaxID=6958 RepID=A0A1Y3BAT4_EURMA|nr:baculoviral IAP repeat-containing protein 3-like protein [Euroglyphus maynei]